jgi:predicted nucleic acid-binding protein
VIVLDANILIRAVLGTRVLDLIDMYAGDVRLFAPELAFQEAEKYLPGLLARRDPPEIKGLRRRDSGQTLFNRLKTMVEIVPEDTFLGFSGAAMFRLRKRDPNDVPILAAALALNCPIWTEDRDFFGVGVATWTTDRVEIYLQSRAIAK